MFDCHIHSSFSTDSNIKPDLFCQKAMDTGLQGIIFTDHIDYDFPGHEDEFQFDFDEYSAYMDNLKEKSAPALKVLKGVEIGIQPHVIERTNRIFINHDFDYVICSVHILDGIDPYDGEYYKGKSKQQAYEIYLEKVLEAITLFKNFDMAGHINYIIRCAEYEDRSLRYNDHKDILDTIFRILISEGKGFEINTGSFREFGKSPVPEYDLNILKRYKELGGELLCLGSDAHSLSQVGYKFGFFKELIKEAGFNYICHFENRKPVFTRI
ncbi:MAG TPA: histidinol-phosphatase HisJ family protein [Clostridiaceae bacterium]|nr:histidinol-phosphatase HisJ family protein [Clostridiaceae bacterium]